MSLRLSHQRDNPPTNGTAGSRICDFVRILSGRNLQRIWIVDLRSHGIQVPNLGINLFQQTFSEPGAARSKIRGPGSFQISFK